MEIFLLNIALFQDGDFQEPRQLSAFSVLILAVAFAMACGIWWILKQSYSNKDLEQENDQKPAQTQPQEVRPPTVRPQSHDKPQATPFTKETGLQPENASRARPSVFVSYRRQDSGDVTGRIYDRLAQHFGKDSVFKDVDSIPLGVDFRKQLGDSVGQCNVLLAVIGRQWLAGDIGRLHEARDFVRIEMEAALQRDIPVVPILVQGASMPNEEDLPETLRSLAYRNGIAVRPDPDFHQDMDRLIRGIERYLKTSG